MKRPTRTIRRILLSSRPSSWRAPIFSLYSVTSLWWALAMLSSAARSTLTVNGRMKSFVSYYFKSLINYLHYSSKQCGCSILACLQLASAQLFSDDMVRIVQDTRQSWPDQPTRKQRSHHRWCQGSLLRLAWRYISQRSSSGLHLYNQRRVARWQSLGKQSSHEWAEEIGLWDLTVCL